MKNFKNALLGVLGFVLGLAILFGICYGFGLVEVGLTNTIGIKYEDAKRNRFENSTSYVHGMIDRLSEYKRQFDTEDNVDNKIAILNTIDDEFAQFDETKIDNSTLRAFLIDVRNGSLRQELENTEN